MPKWIHENKSHMVMACVCVVLCCACTDRRRLGQYDKRMNWVRMGEQRVRSVLPNLKCRRRNAADVGARESARLVISFYFIATHNRQRKRLIEFEREREREIESLSYWLSQFKLLHSRRRHRRSSTVRRPSVNPKCCTLETAVRSNCTFRNWAKWTQHTDFLMC